MVTLGLGGAVACSSDDDDNSGSSGAPGDASVLDDGASTGDGGSKDDANGQDAANDSPNDGGGDEDATVAPGAFTLTSTAYAEGGLIPPLHTCNGANLSPALAWTSPPAGTQSYAVVMRDLSLGNNPNYHWVIYDIPAVTTSLPQGVEKAAAPALPAGAKQTQWSFGASVGYSGPCPPVGQLHDYQLTVYAFASPTIPVPGGTTAPADADAVIQANKTASATLNGKYQQ